MKKFCGKPVVTPTFGGSQWREPILLRLVSGIFVSAKYVQQHSTLQLEKKQKYEKFRCVLCTKVYSRAYNLETHMKCAHPGTY
jgi:hypothetical protein